jgi:carbamoyltransferase
MLSLGISCNYHDSAVALSDENSVLFAAQEERFTRRKGDSSFPTLALDALLKHYKISIEDITHISYYENPKLKRQRILKTFARNFPTNISQIQNFVETYEHERFFPLENIENLFSKEVKFYQHHQSHAASSFFPSPFESAAVLVMDGVGEWDSTSIYAASRSKPFLNQLESEIFPDSVGLFYATMTAYAGFKVNSGEYKFMGLAPYGTARYTELIRNNLLSIEQQGRVSLNMQYFGFTKSLKMWSKRMEKLLEYSPRTAEDRIRQFDCDLARSAQEILEEIYIKKVQHAIEITGEKNLCLAGGVALNCVANGKLRGVLPLENIFVQPASGDAGGSLGASLMRIAEEKTTINSRFFNINDSFLGNSYTENDVKKTLDENQLVYTKFNTSDLSMKCAKLLSDEKSIGWFSGRMEFGPRALGARSIIASAVSQSMQSRLNIQIKKRESFRPFAPIVLKEHVHEWFEWPAGIESKFMLFTAEIKKEKQIGCGLPLNKDDSDIDLIEMVNSVRSTIPAVTHVDMSARLQTIDEKNPLRGVLQNYHQLTGIPVLVNTSFNVRNEPIVESPWDAVRCFLTTGLDVLVIEGYLVEKNDQPKEIMQKWRDQQFSGELD